MPPTTIFCNRCGSASAADAQFCQHCGAGLAISASPAAATSISIVVPRYGGFWIRVVAATLDTALLFAALFPIRLLLGSAVTFIGMNAQMPTHDVLLARRWVRIAIRIILAWAYKAGMESSVYQATLGKMAMRLKVTDLAGRRISSSRATARYFAKYLSDLALGLGYVMVAFDEEKQGLHDRIAGTLVEYRHRTH